MRDKWKRNDREIRLALLASGTVEDPANLFDEFKKVITDDEADLDEGTDLQGDAIATKYDFSNAEMTRSQAEVEEEIAKMLAAASMGTTTLDEPTYSEWM